MGTTVSLRVLVQALCVAAITHASAGAEYLIGDPRRLVVGTFSDIHRFSKKLLAAIFPHVEEKHRRELEEALLEAIARVAGTQPDLVLHVSRAVVTGANGDVTYLQGQLGDMASNLTSIAITLHRQDPYRVPGLELFESLLSLGIAEAAAALDLLDRKAYQNRPLVAPIRRPRRLKRKAG